MPTIASRPNVTIAAPSFDVDKIAGIIEQTVRNTMPSDLPELRLCLHSACRALLYADLIDDYFIYDAPRNAGVEVGFTVDNGRSYMVITIS